MKLWRTQTFKVLNCHAIEHPPDQDQQDGSRHMASEAETLWSEVPTAARGGAAGNCELFAGDGENRATAFSMLSHQSAVRRDMQYIG